MGRTLLRVVAVAAVWAGPGPAAPRLKPDPDLKQFQGGWEYKSQTIGGRSLRLADPHDMWVEVGGDTLTMARAAGSGLTYKVVLDPAARPKAIDLVAHDHPLGQAVVQKGIYEWDGEDLRLCFDNTGEGRPKEFRSPAGQDNVYVSVLRRKGK
jgi:uncharacterized protein (TIGR03067 family)